VESAINSKTCYFRFYLHHWLQINLLQSQLCRCIFGPVKETRLNKTSPMKRQVVITHTVTKCDISALLDSWVTNTRSTKTLCPQKNGLSLYFRKNLTYLHVDLLWIGQVFVSCQTIYLWVYVYFQLRTAAFLKAYCAIWVRRYNFLHQASLRVSPCKSTQRRKVEMWARNVREFCLNFDFHITFRDLLHAVKLRRRTDGFTSSPKDGVLRSFSP
jgi:hypothetical protein